MMQMHTPRQNSQPKNNSCSVNLLIFQEESESGSTPNFIFGGNVGRIYNPNNNKIWRRLGYGFFSKHYQCYNQELWFWVRNFVWRVRDNLISDYGQASLSLSYSLAYNLLGRRYCCLSQSLSSECSCWLDRGFERSNSCCWLLQICSHQIHITCCYLRIASSGAPGILRSSCCLCCGPHFLYFHLSTSNSPVYVLTI